MKHKLTTFEATSIIVGAGVGGGVMAVPYLADQAGTGVFLIVVSIGLILNILLNLLLAEVLIRDGRDLQIVELIQSYVFRGRIGKTIGWIFFAVFSVSFVASLTAYVSGAGEVLAELIGIPARLGHITVYVISAAVVFFGLKSVGFSEKLAIIVMFSFAIVLIAGSLGHWSAPTHPLELRGPGWNASLALYGVVLYSLNAAFAVPQAVKGLGRNAKKSVRAIVGGTSLNALLVVLVTIVAIRVSDPVTEIAVVGIGLGTSRLVGITASLFVIIAMITTYWSVSLALSDIVSERLRIDSRIAWFYTTIPTLVLILANLFAFVEYLQIAGGIVALVCVYITIPMYVRAKRERKLPEGGLALGPAGSAPVLAIFLFGMILMAVGSFLGI